MSHNVQEVPAMAEALDPAADSPPAKVEVIDHAEAIEVSAQVASKRQRISDLFTIVSYNSFVHVRRAFAKIFVASSLRPVRLLCLMATRTI